MSKSSAQSQDGSVPEAQAKGGGKVRLLRLDDLDRRTRAYQDTHELRERIIADLGGPDGLSAAQGEIITVAAVLGAMLRDAGARYLKGEPIDLAEFVTIANAQRRHLEAVGLERRLKDVTPTLSEYLAAKEQAA